MIVVMVGGVVGSSTVGVGGGLQACTDVACSAQRHKTLCDTADGY